MKIQLHYSIIVFKLSKENVLAFFQNLLSPGTYETKPKN